MISAVVKVMAVGGSTGGGVESRLWVGKGASAVGDGKGLAGTAGAGAPTCGLRALKASVWAWGEELGTGAGARRALEAAPME